MMKKTKTYRGLRLGVLALGMASILSLAGCYDSKEVEAFLLKPRAPISATEYRILPPDVIQVTSRQVPEIDKQQQQVRPDGKINLPLIGERDVAGKTPKEVEEDIKAAAKQFYNEVDATVVVSAYNSRKFFVYGQVLVAGPVPWTGRDCLLDALARAQPTYLAWPERIIIVRGGDPNEGGWSSTQPTTQKDEYKNTGIRPQSSENPPHKMTINLMAMIRSGDMSNNIYLKPNDVIFVQPNPFAEVGLALQALLFPVRPVLEATRVPASISQATP
jgi:protein involved in polysaccharide export with SLBB domain